MKQMSISCSLRKRQSWILRRGAVMPRVFRVATQKLIWEKISWHVATSYTSHFRPQRLCLEGCPVATFIMGKIILKYGTPCEIITDRDSGGNASKYVNAEHEKAFFQMSPLHTKCPNEGVLAFLLYSLAHVHEIETLLDVLLLYK
ncbi:hypothetical protein LAZ67_1001608 [Cordylochernes scorpioides]|uniref:Uncharacterized protein n=1 Tax=Cordylochernes scorpioides TaxID=51811 RepID=A0ABY6JY84_9ARAC|nr:hypothetical protein LAZ67_1001608 [Cordylochernes scorpioides]